MIVFQVSLTFDPAKEILKIQLHIYILMKKSLFWGKYKWQWQVTFTLPFFNHFSLSFNRKKNGWLWEPWERNYRSSRSHKFFKIDFLKNIAKFQSKIPVLESLSNRAASLKAWNFIKRLQHRCFPVKFAKFLRTAFFTEHLRWLLLKLNILMLQLPIYYVLKYKVSIGMRAMRKKRNILMLQLLIYYILQ